MAKFLWEQRNPWNFDLYTPEEVTKILIAQLKSRYFQQISSSKNGPFKKVKSPKEIDCNSIYGSINLKSV